MCYRDGEIILCTHSALTIFVDYRQFHPYFLTNQPITYRNAWSRVGYVNETTAIVAYEWMLSILFYTKTSLASYHMLSSIYSLIIHPSFLFSFSIHQKSYFCFKVLNNVYPDTPVTLDTPDTSNTSVTLNTPVTLKTLANQCSYVLALEEEHWAYLSTV